jgi:hypothetical protein
MTMKVYIEDGMYITAEYDPKKESLHIRTHEYVAPLINQNHEDKKDPRNGFGATREGALGRRIGAPSILTYRAWQREFERIGGKQHENWVPDWQKFLRKKLELDDDSRTVKKLRTVAASEKHVIIK